MATARSHAGPGESVHRASTDWLPEAGKARISWMAGKDEAVLANIPAEAERALETAELLDKPGAVASYRVYVVLKTGNERASNVVVERPV